MAWFLLSLVSISLIPADFREFIPEVPEHCKSTTYCEDVLNYPQDHIDNIIKNLDHESFGLTNDELLIPEKTTTEKEYSLCKSENKKIIMPKAALNRHGDWQFVINQYKDQQTIEVEICARDAVDKSCGNGVDVEFTKGYTSRCKQKFIYRYMLGLDHWGNVTTITTHMPSCCACVLSDRTVLSHADTRTTYFYDHN